MLYHFAPSHGEVLQAGLGGFRGLGRVDHGLELGVADPAVTVLVRVREHLLDVNLRHLPWGVLVVVEWLVSGDSDVMMSVVMIKVVSNSGGGICGCGGGGVSGRGLGVIW